MRRIIGLIVVAIAVYAAARTKEALVEAIGVALSVVSGQDARGLFEHAGYRPTGHLL